MTRIMVPFFVSAAEMVKGILSPFWPIFTITKWPAFLFSAILGASISNKQIDLVKKYFLDYYVIPDRDEAGKTMAVKLMNAGANLVKIPPQYKDIGEMPDSEIAELLSATTEFRLDGV